MAIRSVVVKYAADVGSLVKDLDSAAKANEKLAGSSDKASKRVDKMAAAGLGLAVAAGVAVGKFAEFDATMSQVAAATGETAAGMASLRDVAIKAGADTQYSATEAAQGITELAKAGVSAQEIIGGGLTGALNLAAAGQIEVADAAEIAATAMTQFGLSGDRVSHVADLLAAGANKAQGGVGDLGMALKQAGLVASQTGLTLEETTAGLTAFAAAGLLGSDAGTSMKSMLQRLTPQSKEAANLMDELGISAYDAGGNFIGLEKFAGNLQTSLKDLTPEQRNAAMAVIFGSDAVRAAGILYKEGAEGIREWTKETNQSGYAAQQAATLTDNLKGDLERLGGSLDTVLIQSGSGANTSLRALVQTGEKLIDVVGKIPGPVLMGAAAFGTLALVGPKIAGLAGTLTGPMRSGVESIRLAAMYARDAQGPVNKLSVGFRTLSTSVGGLRGAAGGIVSMLGGPWGIALMGATAGVTAFATAQANAKAATDELSDTIDKQTGAWTGASKEFVLKAMLDDLDPKAVALLGQLGVNLGDAAQAALDGGPKLAAYQEYLKGVYSAARNLPEGASLAMDAVGGLSSSIGNQNEVAQGAVIIAKARRDAMAEATATDALAAATQGVLAAGISAVGNASAEANPDVDTMGVMLGQLGARSKEADDALRSLKGAVDLLSGGELALRAAQRAVLDQIDTVADKTKALTEAKKKYGAKSREAAAANRDLQTSIEGIALKGQDELKALMDNNASVKDLTTSYNNNRAAVEKALKDRGLHGAALKKETDKIVGTKENFKLLLAEYAKTPSQIATTVKANGTKTAIANVQAVYEVINGVPRQVNVVISVVSNAWAAVANAKAAINSIGASIVGSAKKKATGGAIIGPGTGTSDSIPALLSNGEHVITASEVEKAGGHGAIYRMRHAINTGALKFRDGGAVGYATGGAVSGINALTTRDLSAIEALVRAILNPIADLSTATKALTAAQQVATRDNTGMSAAQRAYNTDADWLRRTKAYQTYLKDEKKDLTNRISVLSKAAAATKGVTKADRDLAGARRQMDALNREINRQDKAVTAAQDKATKSKDRLSDAQSKAKESADRLADAQAELARQQKAVADEARRISDSFQSGFAKPMLDVATWAAQMREGTAQLGTFTNLIEQLRKLGLSEGMVQQIIGLGSFAGGELAKNIIDGGKPAVDSLNKAADSLTKIADRLGITAASGVGRYASGGPVIGPGGPSSDSVLMWGSNGEHMLDAADVRAMGGQAAVLAFRKQLHAGIPGYALGGPVGRIAMLPAAPASAGGASLKGLVITGVMDTPFGPAQVRGVVQDELNQVASTVSRRNRAAGRR